jgi:rod shape-determining protein MreD
MNSRFRNIILAVLVIGQIAIARNYHSWRFNIDLLYLIIFYIAIKSGFMSSVLSAAFIGLCSDYLSGGVMGVFSFSRTLAAYFLNVLARFLDLKKNVLFQLAGFCILCFDLRFEDHGQPAVFSAVVHRHSRHDHYGIRESEIPA